MADSVLDKLKNKVTYRVKKAVEDAVYDPEAAEYAKQKKEEKEQSEESKKQQDETEDTFKAPTDQSAWGKFKKIMNKVLGRLNKIFFNIVLPLLMASLIANESIMYPVPVRIAFFIFTLMICISSAGALGAITFFYIGKAFYHYYVNVMEKRSVYERIIPTVFSLLPITRFTPLSKTGLFFIYPFRYPKTDKDERELIAIMDEYMNTLTGTFTYLDKLKSMPIFGKGASTVEELLQHMHDKPPARAPVIEATTGESPLPAVIEPKEEPKMAEPSAPPA
jgi:hypothetical protein